MLGLGIGPQSNQFLMATLEQFPVDKKRERDTEAKSMNATISHQWRYVLAYGTVLFWNTAMNLDDWRPVAMDETTTPALTKAQAGGFQVFGRPRRLARTSASPSRRGRPCD